MNEAALNLACYDVLWFGIMPQLMTKGVPYSVGGISMTKSVLQGYLEQTANEFKNKWLDYIRRGQVMGAVDNFAPLEFEGDQDSIY